MKESMEKVVYSSLTDAIITRKIAPGTQLIESTIADQLKVSRTPVRNAIRRLESDGFVKLVPNRGAFVIQPSLDEMVEAFQLRKELELIAVKEGFEQISAQQVHMMRELVSKEKQAFMDKDIRKYNAANKEFHLTLARAAANRFLTEFLDKILSQIDIYLLIYNAFHHIENNAEASWDEHMNLINLIEVKDKEAFQKELLKHLQFSLEELKMDSINYKPLHHLFP